MQVTVPSALPEIDEVEVLDLATLAVDAANSDRNTGTARSFRIAGDDAIKIADLFRNLPDGDERRCHTPPFSLRFLANGVEVGAASVCWKCNNLRGKISGRPLAWAFDGSSRTARKLLKILEGIVGHRAKE